MAQPPKYERSKDFTADYGQNTDHRALNKEFDGAALSVNAIRTNLAKIQNDAGGLKAGIVTQDSVAPSFLTQIAAAAKASLDPLVTQAADSALAANTAALASAASAGQSAAYRDASQAYENASSESAVSAGQYAANAVSTQAAINDRYYGPLASDPSVRPSGAVMQAGDRYFNSTSSVEKVYNGATWTIPNVGAADLANATDPAKGAALVGLLLPSSGAEPTTAGEKITRNSIDLFDFIPKSQWAAIRNFTSVTDVTAYINAAAARAKADGKILTVVSGLFIFTAPITFDSIQVLGAGMGRSIFKLKDAVSATIPTAFDLVTLTGDSPSLQGLTVDGNRANQSWAPIGNANYGIRCAYTTGRPRVSFCEAMNVTANGVGAPVSADNTLWEGVHSHGNGKKGLHSGSISDLTVIGGAYYNNQFDSGIGLHQGARRSKVYLAKCYSNGTYGLMSGDTVNDAGTKDIEVAGCEFWSNTVNDVYIDASTTVQNIASGLHDRHADIHDCTFWSPIGVQVSLARYVNIHHNRFVGSAVETQTPFETHVCDNTFEAVAGSYVIRLRGVIVGNSGYTVGDGCSANRNRFVNCTATLLVHVENITNPTVLDNRQIGSAQSPEVRVYNNTDTLKIRHDGPTTLGAYFTAFGVSDSSGTRTTKSAAVPSAGAWNTGDICINSAPAELGTAGSKYIIDRWRCTAGGSPGTWLPQRMLTGN